MALNSIAMKRSGAKVETMKTRGSTIGSAAITWLMLQVPAMIEASPVRADARAERAGDDVEQPADDRRAGGEAGRRRGLGA